MGIIELLVEESARAAVMKSIAEGKMIGSIEDQVELIVANIKGSQLQTLENIQALVADTDFEDARIARLTGGSLEVIEIIRERMVAGSRKIEDLMFI